ncbi:hypothetical protein [Streptomyces sp. NPDC050355]|uniref:hypothetical protein n=1 Tax=Streptomyces sp. NPDC050355 TaxID=3365609 RepID=UPI0037A194A5
MSDYVFHVLHTGEGPNGTGVSAIDPATGQIQSTVPLGGLMVLDLVAAPGSTLLYVLVLDKAEIRVIDTRTLAVTGAFDIDTKAEWEIPSWRNVNTLAVSRDGTRLYVGHSQGVTEIDTTTRTPVRTLEADRIERLLLSTDGQYLYGTDGGLTVTRFDLATGEQRKSEGLNQLVEGLTLSVDDTSLYAYSTNAGSSSRWGTVLTLDAGTLKQVGDPHLVDGLRDLLVHPDGKRLMALTKRSSSWGYSPVLDTRAQQIGGHRLQGFRPAVSPDGTSVCTVDGTDAWLSRLDGDDPRSYSTVTLPGRGIAVTTAAAVGAHATKLTLGNGRAMIPVTVPGLTAHLATADGTPVSGAPLRFISAGGLDLGSATTGADGRATHTAHLQLPIDPATGQIDTSSLAGPYTVTYPGTPAYQPTEAEGTISLD